MRTAIKARHVLYGAGAERHWMRDAYVLVDGTAIESVSGEEPGGVPVIDLGEAVLTPGLIDLDALVDVDHLILDSWHSPEESLEFAGSAEYWREGRRETLTAEERETLRTYGLLQLVLHGITSFMPIASEVHLEWGESAAELHHVADVARELGVRAWLGPSYRSAVAAVEPDARGVPSRVLVSRPEAGEAGLREATEFLERYRGGEDPLITPVLLPCRIETLDRPLLEATARVSEEHDALVRLHSLQQGWERELIRERHGVAPLDLIESAGLLTDRLLIPHALWTDMNPEVSGREIEPGESEDLPRLTEAGASVIHCPLTTFRYGNMLRTLGGFLEAGINVALGTDSFPPDLIRGIDVGFHSTRLLHGHGEASLAMYLDAATTGGARALRRPDLGTIQPGAAADLTAFSLADFRDGVHEDPLRTLVLNGSARNATFSMVAGRVVMRDGAIPGVDLEGVRTRAQAVFAKLREGYSVRDRRGRTAEQIFPPTYPTHPVQPTHPTQEP
jgi:8-oxoguanine deaminase